MMRCGDSFVHFKNFGIVAEGKVAYEQSRVGDQKAAADQALADASNTWTPAPTNNTKSRKATL